ncbi:hypothetical protein DAI22_09g051400 [Oryza sativa Japonica Group]|nr:hypothetical protein DAI22_09g051400 [Oryza sativa Japonica Group]
MSHQTIAGVSLIDLGLGGARKHKLTASKVSQMGDDCFRRHPRNSSTLYVVHFESW